MVEWYRTHAAYDRIVTDVERLVASTARALRGLDVVPGPAGPVDLRTPWPRMTVAEAFRLFAGVDLDSAQDIQALSTQARDAGCRSIDAQDDWESGFHKLLVERVEPGLTALRRGIHLRQYPVQLAALAQREPDDATVAQRFESYAGGLELANGFGELTDPREQRRRFRDERLVRRSHGLCPLPVDEPFLRDLQGMRPASGVALGLDRLLMVVTSADHIDDVVGF